MWRAILLMEGFKIALALWYFRATRFHLSPLTTDYDLLKSYLDEINFEMIENRGTAIGSALAVVTNRMSESETKSKVCILLSDGDNTAGNIDPITAAELAAAYGIKIYTIVVGKEGLVPFGKDFFGRPNMIENTIDETTMRKIADIGGGEFFRAADSQALKQVFAKIDQYEKAEIKETRFKDTSDYYFIYLQWGVSFFLLWLLLKSDIHHKRFTGLILGYEHVLNSQHSTSQHSSNIQRHSTQYSIRTILSSPIIITVLPRVLTQSRQEGISPSSLSQNRT